MVRPFDVLVFGGTTEARELAAWLGAREGFRAVVSSATAYGGSLVPAGPCVDSRAERLDPIGMMRLMRERPFSCVVDATHPYAFEATENVRAAAAQAGLAVLRLVREGEPAGPWTSAGSVREAAELAAKLPGRILVTTGVKELAVYAQVIEDFRERVFARVLPVEESLRAAWATGIPEAHLIAMQGPFSTQLNEAVLHEFGIATLTTKASGTRGGFWEKVEAARSCGTHLIVVSRPAPEQGLSLEDVQVELVRRAAAAAASGRSGR